LKPRQGKNTGERREPSTADSYFLDEVRTGLQADLERLTGKKVSGLSFKVDVPPMERFGAIMGMSIPQPRRGRPIAGETARVIKAEAFRKLTRQGSMREMAKTFFTDKPEPERYDRYRAIVVQHSGKIKELLSSLKR
jgi:hypothetical protein